MKMRGRKRTMEGCGGRKEELGEGRGPHIPATGESETIQPTNQPVPSLTTIQYNAPL